MSNKLNPDDVVESLRQRRALMQNGRMGPAGGRGYHDDGRSMTSTSQHFEAHRMQSQEHEALSSRQGLPLNRRPLQSNRPMHSGVFGAESNQQAYAPMPESRALVAKREPMHNQYTVDRHFPPQPPVTNINALRWKMRS